MLVEEFFRPGGILGRALPGYEPRAGQVEMAHEVHNAIGAADDLIVEAPTGVGKSFAYLVPALEFVREQADKVTIVTSSINLQEQLIKKDLPMLKKLLSFDFSFVLAKGINNYLCHDAFEDLKDRGGRVQLRKKYGDIVDEVEDWALTTVTGDKSELRREPPAEVWRRFSTDIDGCLKKACHYWENCPYGAAKQGWRTADVLVTNYHLYFTQSLSASALGHRDVVIFDEAHRLADIARDFFGARVTLAGIRRAASHLPNSLLRDTVEVLFEQAFDDLEAYARSEDYSGYLPISWEGLPMKESWTSALRSLIEVKDAYLDLADALRGGSEKYERVMGFVSRCRKIIQALTYLLTEAEEDAEVYKLYADDIHDRTLLGYAEIEGNKPVLGMKQLDVAGTLKNYASSAGSRIFCSATLRVNGSFQYFKEELGLDASTLAVQSPFNLQKQVVFYASDELPSPAPSTRNQHLAASAQTMLAAVRAAHGRTMLLFTSRVALEFTKNVLLAADLPYRLLVQGEHTKLEMLRCFKEEPSVLLGLSSFWEGVDVPGDALTCLCIDKLPFPSPNTPMMAYYADHDPAWFEAQALPRAVVAMRQGIGRLIRSTNDYGLLVITDPRVVTKRYGDLFLSDLDGAQMITDTSEFKQAIAYLDYRKGQR